MDEMAQCHEASQKVGRVESRIQALQLAVLCNLLDLALGLPTNP